MRTPIATLSLGLLAMLAGCWTPATIGAKAPGGVAAPGTAATASPEAYYVKVAIDGAVEERAGLRVPGPTTVRVEAPSAKIVEVLVRPLDGPWGSPTAAAQLLGRDETPEDGFTFSWDPHTDRPHQILIVNAFGQPDVPFSRTASPIYVVLPN